MIWDLEALITESDIEYELAIIKDNMDLSAWTAYYEHRLSRTLTDKVFLLERAVRQFPASTEFWNLYLEVMVTESVLLEYAKNRNVSLVVARLFQRALLLLFNNESIWIRFLKFIIERLSLSVTFIRRTFNKCLRSLDPNKHILIWPLFIGFANKVGGPTGAAIYRRYLKYGVESILYFENDSDISSLPSMPQVVSNLVLFHDFDTASGLLHLIITNPEKYTALAEMPQQFALEYLDVISKVYTDSGSDDKFEVAMNYILTAFPDQISAVYLKALSFFLHNDQRLKYHVNDALCKCMIVSDFVTIFDAYAEHEQNRIESMAAKLESDSSLDVYISLAISQYETFIKNRPLLLNDLLIRQDPHNLDAWIARVEIFSQDIEKVLLTYVTALSIVNPLKAHLLSGIATHNLSKLWLDYAAVYSTRGDTKTALSIFTKGITLVFPNPNDLAQIYQAWSETLCADGDDAGAIKVVETALVELKSSVKPRPANMIMSASAAQSLPYNSKLWNFYLDLLESMVDTDSESKMLALAIKRVCDAYKELISRKVASPLNIFNFATFLKQHHYYEEMFRAFDVGIALFADSQVRAAFWTRYLQDAKEYMSSVERVRDLFDHCVFGTDKVAPQYAESLVKMSFEYEKDSNASGLARKILMRFTHQIHTLLKTPNNPSAVELSNMKQRFYIMLIDHTLSVTNDSLLIRETFELCLNDDQLTGKQTVELALKYISFEETERQFTRARTLFKYVADCGSPKLESFGSLWIAWEKFELLHGNEASYKVMLRAKRLAKSKHISIQEAKIKVNSLGFIKESESAHIQRSNPNQIELDLD